MRFGLGDGDRCAQRIARRRRIRRVRARSRAVRCGPTSAARRPAAALSQRPRKRAGPTRRSRSCGRDSRSAPTCSWAAADCRAETACPTAVA